MGAGLLQNQQLGQEILEQNVGVVLETTYRERAAALLDEELDTELWVDLHDAVDLAMAGDFDSALDWLEETQARFQSVWNSYETNTCVYEDEITAESVIGHSLLKEGVGHWLAALELLGEGDLEEVLVRAEFGQRLLVLVQILEEEAAAAEERFFLNWN